jgi:hypothetical protein
VSVALTSVGELVGVAVATFVGAGASVAVAGGVVVTIMVLVAVLFRASGVAVGMGLGMFVNIIRNPTNPIIMMGVIAATKYRYSPVLFLVLFDLVLVGGG